MSAKKIIPAVLTGVLTLAAWEFFVKPKLSTLLTKDTAA